MKGNPDAGPFSATEYGACAFNHPVNHYGRCLEMVNGTCPPTAAARNIQLLTMEPALVRDKANLLGIADADTMLIAWLVPLIITAEGLS